ncbi:MAG: hypothetical protein IT514_13990 [Burkholderiales bacterium]|nr:hypothetical protein [Burkholderiales bacterium]
MTSERGDIPLTVDFHVHMLDEEAFKASTGKTVQTGFGANAGSAPHPERGRPRGVGGDCRSQATCHDAVLAWGAFTSRVRRVLERGAFTFFGVIR